MTDWKKKTLEEDPSPGLEGRVYQAVKPIIEAEARPASSRWAWFAVPALTAAVAVAVVLPRLREAPPAPSAAAEKHFEIALEFSLYRDLEEIEKMDFLIRIGEPAKWPANKKREKI